MRATCIVMAFLLTGAVAATPLSQATEPAPAAKAQSSGVHARAIPASERQALVDLYTITNGASWTHNTNWNGAAGTECSWYGVTCDSGGTTVQQLKLGSNNLVGTLPATLGSLINLQILHLYSNRLSGSIPNELGNLTNLQWLELSHNQLTGSIPPQLGNLVSLQILALFSNQLTGAIPDLSALTNLTVLELSYNPFSPGPVPTWIANLTKLQNLQLTSNQLTGSIPAGLGSLNSLQVLDLNNNQLTGPIPASLGSLTSLQNLFLGSNQLTGSIPTWLGGLTKLQFLSLWGNQLTGSIPAELGSLTNLQILDLNTNQLTGSIPAEIGSLTNLTYLDLFDDQLAGSIPTQLGNLGNLQSLYLNTNQLTGPIPTQLGNLTNLQKLTLGQNRLTGAIPTQFGSLSKLQVLDLSGNQLTGSIPVELGSLTKLQYLYLYANQLTGSIPTQLGSLTNLTGLYLYANNLTGSIPSELGSLTTLQYLGISSNTLSGAIPTSLESLTKLVAGQSDLRWNALYSTDATLTSFLNGKQNGGNWQSTQTVAPTGVAAGATTSSSVALSWMPIAYASDTGGYRAYYSTKSGGPYTAANITTNKSAPSIVVSGLSPGTLYYFIIRTITNPNGNNRNTVTSDPSAEVHATTSGGTCTSPSITSQPQSQSIQSGQTATLSVVATGTTPLSYQWYRGSSGDTSHPVGSNASTFTTPALTATTSYWVQVSNSCGHADSATATVTVGASYSYVVWVPVASHVDGANNSHWRSDLGLLNVGTVTANVQIRFFSSNGVVSSTTYVSPGVQWVFTDVVGQLPASGSGAIEVLSDRPLKVTARTYSQVPPDASCDANGTQGQDYPAVVASDGLAAGQSAYLGGLRENVPYHSNIGVVNTGTGSATVLVELYAGTGNKLTDYTVNLAAGQWSQETQPFFHKAGLKTIDRGYAKITVQSGSGVFGFASVIDNTTNDPTTVTIQQAAAAQFAQQGSKLVGTGAVGAVLQGQSVAISADGNTAIIGGDADHSSTGAAWVYTRSGGVWSQQGSKLVGTNAVGAASQGISVAISADGNTAIVGGYGDNSYAGAAWVFTRSGGVWSQQGSKLVGAGAADPAYQGFSAAISGDGNIALVGGYGDNSSAGAAWVFTRSEGVWSQQGSKLVGGGAVGASKQGDSVAISGDGMTAIVGAPNDNLIGSGAGAAWVFSASSYVLWVPVASHVDGANNSHWRSDLGLLNAGSVTANVQIKFFGSAGVVTYPTAVLPQVQSMLTDVVGQLPASGSGAIEVISDQSLNVTARTYSQVPLNAACYAKGTEGQDYPAVGTGDGLVAGQSAFLAGLVENKSSYRSNLGVVNTGTGSATVLVELFNGDGTKFTDYTVNLAAGQWAQETQPFKSKAGQTAMDRGYAKITVQTGTGVFGFASVINNITNDPTSVATQR
ncbi:MAG: leucine-rich repeat domain-containing protein [Thermoanaerobaculales bacterium]